ncbi:MAG: hypothetical protein EHM48_07870 [Planctomycetaceae bacterium]|nr:MAG: hypothetical protein EHM48_07870 [Planctomycetaceae bacterium]
MKILIDMNLSPDWVGIFESNGWHSIHWSKVGDGRASDLHIMEWAKANDYVVLMHDLDFGAILAATQLEAPSIVQVRTQDVLPSKLAPLLIATLKEHAATIESGALVVLDEIRTRVRILPLPR